MAKVEAEPYEFELDAGSCALMIMWSFAGAVLAFFGFIHGTQLGWAMSPQVALGYALFGAVCLAASLQREKAGLRV